MASKRRRVGDWIEKVQEINKILREKIQVLHWYYLITFYLKKNNTFRHNEMSKLDFFSQKNGPIRPNDGTLSSFRYGCTFPKVSSADPGYFKMP